MLNTILYTKVDCLNVSCEIILTASWFPLSQTYIVFFTQSVYTSYMTQFQATHMVYIRFLSLHEVDTVDS